MGYDGTIRIDSSLNPSGFNKGTKSLSSSLSGLMKSVAGVGKALLAAFVGGTIISAIRGIIGSFDLMNSSIGGSLKPLSTAFETLKGSFANLIATALIPLVPYIVTVVNWLTNLVQIVTQVVAALFGMQKTVGGITKEVKKTGKEAKGALAAFDQINVLAIPKKEDAPAEQNTPTPAALEVGQEMLARVQEVKKWFVDMWDGVKKAATDAWEWFLKIWTPVADWVKEHIIDPIAKWAKENPEAFGRLLVIIGLVIIGFYLLAGVISFVTTVGAIMIGIWDAAVFVFGLLLSPIGLVVLALVLWIATILYVIAHWEELKTTVYQILFIIGYYVGNAALWLMEKFGKALDWVKNKFHSIFEDIRTFVAGIISNIIDMFSGMNESIVNAIQTALNLVGGTWLGGVGMSMPVSNTSTPMQMPHLATGAAIPPNAAFAAILGDQRAGYNIEAPAKMFEEMLNRAVQSAGSGETVVNMVLTLDGEKIYDSQKRVQTRRGTNLIKSGAFS